MLIFQGLTSDPGHLWKEGRKGGREGGREEERKGRRKGGEEGREEGRKGAGVYNMWSSPNSVLFLLHTLLLSSGRVKRVSSEELWSWRQL